MRRVALATLRSVALVSLVAGCSIVGADPDGPRLRTQAEAALARWADAVAAVQGATGFVPVGELTGQIGDWEPDNGAYKSALGSGIVEAAAPLPTDAPPDGAVRWPDGTTTTVRLISASMAVEDIRAESVQPCPDCPVLRVTAARLTTLPFETSRGRADVPTWAFTVEGTAVQISRVAVAAQVVPAIPPWDAEHPPIGLSIDRATVSGDGRTLVVWFIGAPGPGSEPCGEDYAGEAVESDLAVVAIVHVHRNPAPVACTAIGAARTATALLASPLGDRAVLEVKEGRPVPVTRAP